MNKSVHFGDYPPKDEVYNWTSDGSGDATVSIVNIKNRRLRSVKTVPGTGVSAYSVTLIDEDGLDLFDSEGLNRSATVAEAFYADTDIFMPDQELTLTISGAGDTKTGTVYLRVE